MCNYRTINVITKLFDFIFSSSYSPFFPLISFRSHPVPLILILLRLSLMFLHFLLHVIIFLFLCCLSSRLPFSAFLICSSISLHSVTHTNVLLFLFIQHFLVIQNNKIVLLFRLFSHPRATEQWRII